MGDPLLELYTHHRWANRKLFDACERLADAELDASIDGVYGTIRDTLVHLVAADTRYIAAMRNEPRPTEVSEDKPFPGFAFLRQHMEASCATLLKIAADVRPDDRMRGEMRGESYDLPLSVPLAQVINHGTEHRANITSIMLARGLEPPGLDLWHYAREGGGR